jgi:hypothetical protein
MRRRTYVYAKFTRTRELGPAGERILTRSIERISNSEKEHKAMFSFKMRSLTTLKDFARENWQVKFKKLYSSPNVIAIALVMLLLGGTAFGQTTTSTIEGTVTDVNGAVIPGAEVKAVSATLGTERTIVTGSDGKFRIVSLPAGSYTLTVTKTGFAPRTSELELTLNRTVTLDVQLAVGALGGVVTVSSDVPLITTDSPATGATITPKQIQDLPVNGRNYLDLLQLVPGTAINRQADPEGDAANPVLGERSGNNNFLIDGNPNKDTVNGGPAAQFNQETIAEFQVLTGGYKAEFGQASGAVVNVITKTGGNQIHGVGSFFHRNDAFDSVNSLDATQTSPPELSRFDYSVALGGPIVKDKFFFFGSAERITEDREIDFAFPDVGNPVVNQLIRDLETQFDVPSLNRETRMFLKLNQQLGHHTLNQQINYTNAHVKNFAPLSAGNSTPSTRNNFGSRNLMLAFGDTVLLGDSGNPWILTLRGSYRDEPSSREPAHPGAGGGNNWDPFAVPICGSCILQSPLPNVNFGNPFSPSNLDQKYTSLTAFANKRSGDHDIKFGWNFLRTKVDGLDSRLLQGQLFATTVDFAAFPPIFSGISLLADRGGATPEDDEIHLNNNYNALFVQDDWRIRNNLTLSLGLRWDYDSEFEAKTNFAPRLGVTWAVNPRTVVRAQFGQFYDQFRLGIAQNVPQFGGSDQGTAQKLLFPRGLYGSPSFISSAALFILGSGPCFSNMFLGNLTDAQITANNIRCPLASALPLVGVDRLNNVVAAGHAPIPANSIITIDTIQSLSGLSPDAYITQANAAIGIPGFFAWGPFGVLSNQIIPGFSSPDVLENIDQTPNTLAFSAGFQREITRDLFMEVDYHHRAMRNILGLRDSNIAFRARLTGLARTYDPPGVQLLGFGPYYEGTFDGLVISLNKRFSNRYTFGASYTYTNATDNTLGITSGPSDSFIGDVPLVTDPGRAATSTVPACAGQSNQNGSFTACNGNFVPKAGTFWNGPDVDKGPSSLALDHVFQVNGMVSLPWDFQISGLFRAQSGFRYSKAWVPTAVTDPILIDPDGNGNTTGIDIRSSTRNEFTSPPFVNLDLRFGKQFKFGERYAFDIFYEIFNVFNRQNPASVSGEPGPTFGTVRQVLPGREGQIGFRFSF